MLHEEIEQTDADLADTGLQRPKGTKKDTVDTPQTDKITVPSSSAAEPDTEALMETTECPPPQSIAEDLTCKYLFFSICMYVCLCIYLSVCLSVFKCLSLFDFISGSLHGNCKRPRGTCHSRVDRFSE